MTESRVTGSGIATNRSGDGLVPRGILFDRLSAAGPGSVVLVCAPAGSGKTVLVRSWIATANLQDRVAWVSVERGERDAQRFWLSVIDALSLAAEVVHRVDPAPGFRGEVAVRQLLTDLSFLDDPIVLVIDDLHELDSADAQRWLETFLAHLPSQLQAVLSTREDPRLGLHRLRLAGRLTEVRAPDLRFSLEETKELLREAGIKLSDRGVALLYERTEGWAAGLRLAVISLSQHPDPERFVTEFSGSERTVAGYLVAEVLERQPAEVRDLLLRTSVLERVSGALADCLTGGSGAERILQELEDANAFITSLDVGRTWFRYHYLFADLLELELRRESPGMVAPLHRDAARWFAEEGYTVEAVRHAQAARDWALASRLLADNHVDLTLDGRTGAVRELLRVFPDSVAAADAELALVFSLANLLEGALDASTAYIALAGRLRETVPDERRRQFDPLMAVLRLVVARWRGDLETALEARPLAEAVLEAQPPGEHALSDAFKSAAFQNLGIAELWCSRPDDGRRDLERALALARRAERPWLALPSLGHLAMARLMTGASLSDALALSEDAVRTAERHGWSEDPALVTALATGAVTLLWLGRFDEAERWLDRGMRALQPDGEPGTELIVHYAGGLLRYAQHRYEDALAALAAAERMQSLLAGTHAFGPAARARAIRTQVRMGQLDAAKAALAETSGEEGDVSGMRMAAAVVHLAGGEPDQAVELLAPVIDGVAPAIHRSSAATEAQLLDALARDQSGDERAANASAEHALELAEPEGIILPFVLVPVQGILERLPRHGTAHAALRRTVLDVLSGSAPQLGGKPAELLDDLSEAELRVVRYLPSNLRAPEIAAELYVSTNTVRTHLRHIYAKLGAHGRAEAVARARELGLLAPSLRR